MLPDVTQSRGYKARARCCRYNITKFLKSTLIVWGLAAAIALRHAADYQGGENVVNFEKLDFGKNPHNFWSGLRKFWRFLYICIPFPTGKWIFSLKNTGEVGEWLKPIVC